MIWFTCMFSCASSKSSMHGRFPCFSFGKKNFLVSYLCWINHCTLVFMEAVPPESWAAPWQSCFFAGVHRYEFLHHAVPDWLWYFGRGYHHSFVAQQQKTTREAHHCKRNRNIRQLAQEESRAKVRSGSRSAVFYGGWQLSVLFGEQLKVRILA